jgi:hypothetical protein
MLIHLNKLTDFIRAIGLPVITSLPASTNSSSSSWKAKLLGWGIFRHNSHPVIVCGHLMVEEALAVMASYKRLVAFVA